MGGSGVRQPLLFFMHRLFIYLFVFWALVTAVTRMIPKCQLSDHIISSALRTCGVSQAGPLSSGSRVSIYTNPPISTINLLFYFQKYIGWSTNDSLSEGILWAMENRE